MQDSVVASEACRCKGEGVRVRVRKRAEQEACGIWVTCGRKRMESGALPVPLPRVGRVGTRAGRQAARIDFAVECSSMRRDLYHSRKH
jgi:hypothetical protein